MKYEVIGPLAYQGKRGCRDPGCRNVPCPECKRFDCDHLPERPCHGWHCSYCDEPCSSQGHFGCEVAETILAEARRHAP